MPLDKKSEELSNVLSRTVFSRFEKARTAKRDVYDTMMDCYNMSHGKPLVPANDNVNITMDIASPVVQNIIGLLRHILLNNEQAPFVIKPTPRAELNDTEMAEIYRQVEANASQFLAQGMDQSAIEDVIRDLRQTVLLEANNKARLAAERQTTIIQDQLHDAGWKQEFIAFMKHFCIYPAAVMKAPVLRKKKMTSWDGESVRVVYNDVVSVELVSPFDFYPAPYARDVDSADYIIERRRLTRGDLSSLIDMEDYDNDAIDVVLDEYPDGYVVRYEDKDGEPDHEDSYTTPDITERGVYDALGYYGSIRGSVLVDAGFDVSDERLDYEVEVWVIGGVVIKAVLNPDPLGKRPFFVASFDATTDSIWGVSPMMRLRDTQKVATAAIRNLVRNMSYSSGPIGEVIVSRIKDGKPPQDIEPHTIRLVEDAAFSGVSATAYNFYQVPSLSAELSALFEKFVNYSYELLGIPRVAFGQSDALGSVGRTSGGISIVMNQATKAIKNAMTELESGLIEPVVNSFILYNQLNNPDPALRGDIRAFAKGVSGLIEQESKADDLQWALQSISAIMTGVTNPDGSPVIPPMAAVRLLYEQFKVRGIPTQGIFPDFDRQQAIQEDLNQVGIATTDTSAAPVGDAGSTIPLDGRNGAAAATIAEANGL